jgi:hypothetical protein
MRPLRLLMFFIGRRFRDTKQHWIIGTKDLHLLSFRLSKNSNMEQHFNSLTALREIIRILCLNPSGFLVIAALFICPVPAILLSIAFLDQSVVD